MVLLALIIYTRVRVVRTYVCVNCVCVYTIEHAYARAYICACTCIRVSLRLFTRKHSFLRVYACVRLRACLRTDLSKTQNAFARKIFQHSNALGFRNFQDVLYIHVCIRMLTRVHCIRMYVRTYMYVC